MLWLVYLWHTWTHFKKSWFILKHPDGSNYFVLQSVWKWKIFREPHSQGSDSHCWVASRGTRWQAFHLDCQHIITGKIHTPNLLLRPRLYLQNQTFGHLKTQKSQTDSFRNVAKLSRPRSPQVTWIYELQLTSFFLFLTFDSFPSFIFLFFFFFCCLRESSV